MKKIFDPTIDRPILRECLNRLHADEGLTPEAVLKLVESYEKRTTKQILGISSLKRFMGGGELKRSIPKLRDVWNCLSEHKIYGKFMPSVGGPGQKQDEPSGDEFRVLSAALMTFFAVGRINTSVEKIEKLRTTAPGQYVMYRPDMRPFVPPMKPSGLIRASNFEIRNESSALVCEERQDFPKNSYGPRHRQKNSGVLFWHDEQMFFIMRGAYGGSFKFGNIERVIDWHETPTEWFRGHLWVVNNVAVFPVVKFFCIRSSGDLKTGLILPGEIPSMEARAFLGRQPNWKGIKGDGSKIIS